LCTKTIGATAEEIEATNPELTWDSEVQSLPLQGPAIEAAHTLFAQESSISEHLGAESDSEHSDSEHSECPGSDHSDSEDNRFEDLMKIIRACLKDAKRHNTIWGIKAANQLVAVTEYVKLRTRYWKHNACQHPCLSASLAIACRMGKGPYFACQIRQNELYLLQNHCLPLPKSYTKHGHHTLLDNEAILHNVRTYLAAQALGTVTPWTFCQHVNEVILPVLEINGTISKSTVQ